MRTRSKSTFDSSVTASEILHECPDSNAQDTTELNRNPKIPTSENVTSDNILSIDDTMDAGDMNRADSDTAPDCDPPVASLTDGFFCCPKCCSYFEATEYSKFTIHLADDCFVRKKHPCQTCGHIFITQSVLDHHVEYVHKNSKSVAKTRKMKPKNAQDIRPESSNVATEELDQKILDFNGEQVASPEDHSQTQKIVCDTNVFRCSICAYNSKEKSHFQKHLKRVHGKTRIKCLHCEFEFIQKHHLREHMNEVHQEEIGFTCKDCGRKFLDKYFQHDCKKIECEVCHQVFNKLGEKKKHMLSSHSEYKPFKCLECSKEFIKIQYLTIHMRIHENIRPYSCEFCEKRFRSKSNYNNHRRLHTGEKPYTCPTCGESLTSPQLLFSHMAMHSGKKDFKCTSCDKVFRNKGDLNRHETIHSGLRVYACHTCGKTFNRRSNCTVHEKSHLVNETKEFRCDICGKDFDRVKKLNRHTRDFHKPEQAPDELLGLAKVKKSKPLTAGADADDQTTTTVQFMDVDDVASNVEVVGDGETTAEKISNELKIRPIGVWQHTEFGFLKEDGTHIMPMYVAVLPCSGSDITQDLETVAKVEVIDSETTSLHIEFEGEPPENGYLNIVRTK